MCACVCVCVGVGGGYGMDVQCHRVFHRFDARKMLECRADFNSFDSRVLTDEKNSGWVLTHKSFCRCVVIVYTHTHLHTHTRIVGVEDVGLMVLMRSLRKSLYIVIKPYIIVVRHIYMKHISRMSRDICFVLLSNTNVYRVRNIPQRITMRRRLGYSTIVYDGLRYYRMKL